MIFIDSDAYLALNLKEDSNQVKALRVAKMLELSHESTVTSWEVVDEVTTKLSYYYSRDMARAFIANLQSSDTIIQYMVETLAADVFTFFLKQTSKKVSLTDCTNMVIARNLGIKTFFSFDHHYEQNGFRLLK
ncbi:MAG: hypothetical protein AAB492_03780 [Patescibacteria group bacterium]